MPTLILPFLDHLPWRAVAAVAVALALFAAGWTANGWRWSARLADIQTSYAAAATKASEEARAREADLAAQMAVIDAAATDRKRKADDEIAALRAGVDAGAVRLRVAAKCPAAGMPQTSAGPGLGRGPGPELDAAARPAYFALRAGLTQQAAQLAACRAVLAAERRNSSEFTKGNVP